MGSKQHHFLVVNAAKVDMEVGLGCESVARALLRVCSGRVDIWHVLASVYGDALYPARHWIVLELGGILRRNHVSVRSCL